jgi:hypothetical protein
MFQFFTSLLSANLVDQKRSHLLQEAYEQIEEYLLREDLEMSDMALREYQSKISQGQQYYSEALYRLDPLIKS